MTALNFIETKMWCAGDEERQLSLVITLAGGIYYASINRLTGGELREIGEYPTLEAAKEACEIALRMQ